MKLEEILPEIRKGRRFKLPGRVIWLSGFETVTFYGDLMSEHFELEPIKKEISREDLERVWNKAGGHWEIEDILKSMLAELGL